MSSNKASDELGYADAFAREFATETCVRCSGTKSWKTAAMMFEGLAWQYYYCYECRRWFRRHYMYRYAVSPVDDSEVIRTLLWQLDLQRGMVEESLEGGSKIRRTLASLQRFSQWILKLGRGRN